MESPAAAPDSDLPAYAASLGITPAYLSDVRTAVLDGELEMAQVAGFSAAELEALYLQGMALVRQRHYMAAGHIFLYLCQLDRRAGKYFRALGLAFHCLHDVGWADGAYMTALALEPDDRIAMALRAELALYLSGKRQAHAALAQVVALGARRPDEQPYIERAAQVLAKIRL